MCTSSCPCRDPGITRCQRSGESWTPNLRSTAPRQMAARHATVSRSIGNSGSRSQLCALPGHEGAGRGMSRCAPRAGASRRRRCCSCSSAGAARYKSGTRTRTGCVALASMLHRPCSVRVAAVHGRGRHACHCATGIVPHASASLRRLGRLQECRSGKDVSSLSSTPFVRSARRCPGRADRYVSSAAVTFTLTSGATRDRVCFDVGVGSHQKAAEVVLLGLEVRAHDVGRACQLPERLAILPDFRCKRRYGV